MDSALSTTPSVSGEAAMTRPCTYCGRVDVQRCTDDTMAKACMLQDDFDQNGPPTTEAALKAWREATDPAAARVASNPSVSGEAEPASREDCPLEQPNPPHVCPKCGMTNNNTCPVGDEEIG